MPVAALYPFFDHPGPLAFAHRGGMLHPRNLGRENSLAAFAVAVELGYRYLETDVHATADGVAVAFHDDVLDRATDRTGAIAALPWAEVSRARIGGVEPIPRLAEVLEAFPDVRVNVDVKEPAAVAPLVDVVRDLRCFDRVCVASFSTRRLAMARALLGARVASAASPAEVLALRFAPDVRVLPPAATRTSVCVQVPVRWRSLTLLTPGFVRRAHELGWQVHVWVVDDAAEIGRLLDLGADGIMSDRIDVLRDTLVARGEWPAGGGPG